MPRQLCAPPQLWALILSINHMWGPGIVSGFPVVCLQWRCLEWPGVDFLRKSCVTLWDPVDYSLPGSSAHGILQARILEWVPFPLEKSFLTQGSNPGFPPCRHILYCLGHQGGRNPVRALVVSDNKVPPGIRQGRFRDSVLSSKRCRIISAQRC